MTTLMTAPAAPAAPAPAAAPAAGAPAAAPADGSAPAPAAPATGETGGAAPAAASVTGAPAGEQPGDAGKTAEQVAADQVAADAAAEAAKAAGAPEQYADFTAPENAQLDAEVMTEFGNVARELNLPQDKAQLLIDKMQPIIATRQAQQVEAMRTTWGEQSRIDPEFGGTNLDANMVHASRAMTAFATPELKTLLDQSGLGNHPELVRFMVKAGKAIGEDKVVTGGIPASGGIRSVADTLYPTPSVKK